MVVIRLTRVGKKNSPAYRVVVADRRRAVKRKFIEVIGHYNPTLKPKEVVIDKERALFWISKGAMPSDTVRNLMADLDILKKSEKTKKVYGKEKKKKELKEATEGKKPEVAVEAPAEKGEGEESEASVEEKPEAAAEAEMPAKEPTEESAAGATAKVEEPEKKDETTN